MPIGGQRLRQLAPLRDDKGQAIDRAPTLIVPRPVKLHGGVDQFGLEWHNIDACVRMSSAVLISLARKRHPVGSIGDVGCHYCYRSFVGQPLR